ncbi:hypothetical protein HT031_002088 [Scenedesmus sp. PABB004]|nr:hypothetical protein HT031_002088 [Scenedesmus sp. PABB004]
MQLARAQRAAGAARPAQRLAAPRLVAAAAGAKGAGGFGKSNKKRVDTSGGMVRTEPKTISRADLDDDAPPAGGKAAKAKGGAGAPPGFPEGWVDLKFKAGDIPLGKSSKPVALATGRALMVYKYDNRVYVSDAASTAYSYPMVDAKVFRDPESGAVAAEVPLDGSVYDLATGAVLKWCPKDSPLRAALGTLKSAVDPTPLKVFPVHVEADGAIWTKLI